MYKKIILTLSIIILVGIVKVPLNAAVYIKDAEEAIQTDKICSNYEYTLFNEGNNVYKTINIYNDENYLLETYEINSENTTFIIPNGINNVKLEIKDLENKDKEAEELKFAVKDCGYDKIKEEYKINKLKANINISQKILTFDTNVKEEQYELYFKTEAKNKAELFTNKTKIEIPTVPYIVQLKETYVSNNKTITNFYEIVIDEMGEYKIRSINDFEISQIKAPPISNIYIYIFLGVFVLFLIFKRKEKKYKKKRKRLVNKRRRKQKQGRKNVRKIK